MKSTVLNIFIFILNTLKMKQGNKRKYTKEQIDGARHRIINALTKKKLLQSELSQALGFSHSALSHGLKHKTGLIYKALSKLMREDKVVLEPLSGGRVKYYQLATEAVNSTMGAVKPTELRKLPKSIIPVEMAFGIFMDAVKAEAEKAVGDRIKNLETENKALRKQVSELEAKAEDTPISKTLNLDNTLERIKQKYGMGRRTDVSDNILS